MDTNSADHEAGKFGKNEDKLRHSWHAQQAIEQIALGLGLCTTQIMLDQQKNNVESNMVPILNIPQEGLKLQDGTPPEMVQKTSESLILTEKEHRKRKRRKIRKKSRLFLSVDLTKAKSSAEVLRQSLNELGWKRRELSSKSKVPCDLHWLGISYQDKDAIFSGKVNKFPGVLELVRKGQLSKLLHQMQQLFPEEFNFYPKTWILPEQYSIFCADVASQLEKYPRVKKTFIVKPDSGAHGEGIYLLKNPHHMSMTGLIRPAIVQEYVSKPLLFERTKFDLRVYVLLASINPLSIYVCREGLVRFCTIRYQEPTNQNIHQIYMHLTNYTLNRQSRSYVHSNALDKGSKRTMSSLFHSLALKGYDVQSLWQKIEEIIVKTITSLLPDLQVIYEAEIPSKRTVNPSCFQILGFDILITNKLQPILLEVNANPSLKLDYEYEKSPGVVEFLPSHVDEKIKVPLVKDTLKLLRIAKEISSHCPISNKDGSTTDIAEMEYALSGSGTPSINSENEFVDNITFPESSCLEEIWPKKYGEKYGHLRIMEQVASLFNMFLGVRGVHAMGATGFRTFCRRCKLYSHSLTMVSIDILYIDTVRRWEEGNLDRDVSGMCFGAFLEAFFVLARKKFKGSNLLEKVSALLNHCMSNINLWTPPRFPKMASSRLTVRQKLPDLRRMSLSDA